jgi:hypothetical protein
MTLHNTIQELFEGLEVEVMKRIPLIYTFDKGQADEVWRYSGNSTFGYPARATCFERLPERRLLRRFPEEGMKVLEASVAPGQRISLN